jgi:putative transposase
MRYNFILNNGEKYPVEKMCKHMRVSKNAYYHWVKYKGLDIYNTTKSNLMARIKMIFEESREIYGSSRIQKMLEREDLIYARSYISLLMKEMGLKSVLRRKYVVTTDSKHSFPIANNELDRNFNSLNLGEKWVSDITYIRVNNEWNYLTTIIDLADRKAIGCALSENMTIENTIMKANNVARIMQVKLHSINRGYPLKQFYLSLLCILICQSNVSKCWEILSYTTCSLFIDFESNILCCGKQQNR